MTFQPTLLKSWHAGKTILLTCSCDEFLHTQCTYMRGIQQHCLGGFKQHNPHLLNMYDVQDFIFSMPIRYGSVQFV